MVKIVEAWIARGYSGADHLIDSQDEAAVKSMIGRKFRSAGEALSATERAFTKTCDRRCSTARVRIEVEYESHKTREL